MRNPVTSITNTTTWYYWISGHLSSLVGVPWRIQIICFSDSFSLEETFLGTKSETCIQDNSCIGKWKRKVKNWIHAIFHWLLLYDVLKLLANSTMHLTLVALFTKIWCYHGKKNVVKISIFIHKNLKYQKQQINTRESQWRGNCSFKKHPQLVLYLHY